MKKIEMPSIHTIICNENIQQNVNERVKTKSQNKSETTQNLETMIP